MPIPTCRRRPDPRRALAAALIAALVAGCATTPAAPDTSRDRAAIATVVENFRLALLHKDRAAYLDLFFSREPAAIGWQAVVDDDVLGRIRRERPQAIKARPRPENNFIALIDSVLASPNTEEERIEHVVIDTDGEIGSAAFDYTYLSGGRATNRGREMWQLVRTEQGWKIFSVIYTIRHPLP
jgi:hypothetical protein